MSLLVTGARSGLGRYLAERLGGIAMTRENAEELLRSERRFDVVVHAAYSRLKDVARDDLYKYYQDTVALTERVSRLCRRQLIFVSSVSVYPTTGGEHREDENIRVERVPTLYGATKLLCEVVCAERVPVSTSLRLSSLLGEYSPDNVTMRLLRGRADRLPLTATSVFDFVTYDEVEAVVRAAVEEKLSGVVNVASARPIALERIAQFLGASVEYGDVEYRAPRVDVERAAAIVPSIAADSEEKLRQFAAAMRRREGSPDAR